MLDDSTFKIQNKSVRGNIDELEQFIDHWIENITSVKSFAHCAQGKKDYNKYILDQSTTLEYSETIMDFLEKDNTSTPKQVKQRNILEMFSPIAVTLQDKEYSRQKKRKMISPISRNGENNTESESDVYDSDDLESTIGNDIDSNATKPEAVTDMKDWLQKSLDKIVVSMNESFSGQFTVFTEEIRNIIEDSKSADAEDRAKLNEEIASLRLAINGKDNKITELEKEVQDLSLRSRVYDGRLTRMEKEVSDIKEELLRAETRSMRDNLVFYNIPEARTEDRDSSYTIVMDFLKKEMKIPENELEKVSIDRAHRLGKKNDKVTRAIVAKFSSTEGRSTILKHAKNLDKQKKYGVGEQLPAELRSRKSVLLPKFKEAKQAQQKPRWIKDKLIINDEVHEVKKDKVRDPNLDIIKSAIEKEVKHAPPKKHQACTFQGHAVAISNQDDVIPALHAIYSDTRVASATHNIYAYRLSDGTSVVEHFEDDKEWGGGKCILDILQSNGIENQLICVSRWYGGKHLGPSRFRLIEEAAKSVIDF